MLKIEIKPKKPKKKHEQGVRAKFTPVILEKVWHILRTLLIDIAAIWIASEVFQIGH